MRTLRLPLALAALAAATGPAPAQPPVAFGDAAVHAVQFVDASEGWAVGDDGVVWHSIDGGTTWERQKSGTRASLRGVHFLTPYTGWAVGRLEQPNGGGSVGVMLRTKDGGIAWEEVGVNVLPGLHGVRFFDDANGAVWGDGSDGFPSGIFTTADGGRTWRPAAGGRAASWRAADWVSASLGAVGGAWSKLGVVRGGEISDADIDPLGGRTVHGLKLGKERSFAVGDGGMILASTDGKKWGFADPGLPAEVLAACDFRCVAAVGSHVWVAGRPGGFVLHSADHGKTWETQKTGGTAPLNGIHFLNETTGWAVGELGTILGTTDGGKTWAARRAGGQRAAVLFVHAAGKNVPLDTVALLGAADGYLAAAVGVMSADPATADPKRANDPARLRQAVRLAGGAAGDNVWCFPLPAHAAGLAPRDLMASWDRAHGGKAADQLLRQVVLAVRTWQPEVIVSDVAAADANPADVLVLHAAQEAFKAAADPAAFPEQLALGLKPWAAKKLYALSPDAPDVPVKLDLSEFHKGLADSPRDFSEAGFRVLADEAANVDRRNFRLISHRLPPGAEKQPGLMDGINLAAGGTARREAAPATLDPETLTARENAARTRRQLQVLAASTDAELAGPDKVMAQFVARLKDVPDDVAARTLQAIGAQLARAGKWAEAREVFALVADRYPGHPLAAESFRWLARYHASSETRRRNELVQEMVFRKIQTTPVGGERAVIQASGVAERAALTGSEGVYRSYDPEATMKWHAACLDFEPKLAALGPVYARDPAARLCFMAARRRVGKLADAESSLRAYFKANPAALAAPPGTDPWRDCLAAELWLSNPEGVPVPPKPLGFGRHTEVRPFLDGKLDDACWKDLQPLALRPAAGEAAAEARAFAERYKTEAAFAYDDQFLYVGLTCSHPAGEKAVPVPKRTRDADLAGRDRVDLLIDLDRDYQTYYRFQIDHRGALAEDCCGDRTWNPKYFVAFNPTDEGWTAEIAIPLTELTADKPSHAKAWAVNVSRVVPGKGAQSWSGPADADPRPEGMGLLQFRGR